MAKLLNSPDDFVGLVGATSDALRIRQEFLEKDYWVTELLRSVAQPIDKASLIFKGGTSLSKAFGLIERFSEDVDILVSVQDATLGVGAVHRILRRICDRVGEDLELDTGAIEIVASETGVHRDVRYTYPARMPQGFVTEGVLLEMGRRGGDHPHSRHSLQSIIARHAIDALGATSDEFEEFAPLEMDVLAAERTLVEKLALLHRLSVQATPERLVAYGRHLYDIYKLLSDASVAESLRSGATSVARLADDADTQSKRWRLPYEPRPSDGFADSPAFEATGAAAASLRKGLEATKGLVYGLMPSFEDCLDAVRDHAAVL